MRYGLILILWRRQSQLTPNIPKTKPLYVITVCWTSWGDEGHLRSKGNDDGAVSAHKVKSSVSPGGKKQCLLRSTNLLLSANNTKDPQLEEGANQNTGAPGIRRTPLGGASAPAGQVLEGPSLTFIKEKINVLRTMIKELDNRGSREDDVGGYSSDGTSRSRSRTEQEEWPMPVWCKMFCQTLSGSARNWFDSLDPKSVDGFEELSNKFLEEFSQQKRYEESRKMGVSESHRSVRSEAQTEQEEWPMPVWCKMLCQTLSGSARNWFDSLDPKSMDGFEELSNKFLEEFSQQKRYDKDPTKIHGIKRKPNEGLQAFMDRFKAESAHIKGVPPVLRLSAFMHGHGHPELPRSSMTRSQRQSMRCGKELGLSSVERRLLKPLRNRGHRRGQGRSMRTCAPYARKEGFTPLMKTPKEILAMDNVNFPLPPPMVGTPEKRNMNKLCDYYQDRGHNTNDCYHLKKQIKKAVASGRLAQMVKDIRQSGQKNKVSAKGKENVINMVRSQGYRKRPYERVEHGMDNTITFPSVPRYQLMDCPMVVDAMIEGFREFELSDEVEVERIPNTAGGVFKRSRKGMRSLGVVASTIHSMIKFPTSNGIATIATTRDTLRGCRKIKEAESLSRNARITDPSLMQTSSEVANPKASLAPIETHPQRLGKEPMELDDMEERHQLDNWRNPSKSSLEEKIVDLYHLLEIDWKIESLMRFQYKCFLDAYKGYHYIHMTKNDEDKTAFHTEEGVLCYTKIPFGLKNAGATYQRLVDSAFKEQIGVNLEAYVDDMMIKSRTEQDIIKDLEQTFSTLRGMEEGNFLGYIVTSEGIRANSEKRKAVMDMPSPRTLKKMQSLSGKLAALNLFLSKSVEQSLPLLDTLRKCTNKKDLRWIEAAEVAFLEMKKLVYKFPTLTTPMKGETLMMYLAAVDEAVSGVLLTKRDRRKMPIHYVSRSLQGAKTNHAPMEKLTLAIVHTARRLRRGVWHKICAKGFSKGLGPDRLLADTSTKGMDTIYRWSIKQWMVLSRPHPDSSRRHRILLRTSFDFSNSNNDDEYEALLAGLWIATEMQVKYIHAFVDSKLVASQVDGSYEAKGEKMIKYQEKVLELAGAFNKF
ncbi:reverse transcriptase domain-containing protein [Tanacetum coccineum]